MYAHTASRGPVVPIRASQYASGGRGPAIPSEGPPPIPPVGPPAISSSRPSYPSQPSSSHAHPPVSVFSAPGPPPPVPAGVNPTQWRQGQWLYRPPPAPGAPPGYQQVYGPGPAMQGLPPPQMVGYHVSSGWGIPQQYHPPPKQPDQSYWATQLSENGLGLQGMDIRAPEGETGPDGQKKQLHTPWIWSPTDLPNVDSDPGGSGERHDRQADSRSTQQASHPQAQSLPPPSYASQQAEQQQQQQRPPPSQDPNHISNLMANRPTTQASTASAAAAEHLRTQHSHTLSAPQPQRASERPAPSGPLESFTARQELRPTFSPAIVRTPNHYRQTSNTVSTASAAAAANLASRSVAENPRPAITGATSGRVIYADPDSTPAPQPSSHSSSRPVQRSQSIPTVPAITTSRAAPVSRQSSLPVTSGSRSGLNSLGTLSHFDEDSDGVLSPLAPLTSFPSGESTTSSSSASTVQAQPPPREYEHSRHRDRERNGSGHHSSRRPTRSATYPNIEDRSSGGHRGSRHHDHRQYRSRDVSPLSSSSDSESASATTTPSTSPHTRGTPSSGNLSTPSSRQTRTPSSTYSRNTPSSGRSSSRSRPPSLHPSPNYTHPPQIYASPPSSRENSNSQPYSQPFPQAPPQANPYSAPTAQTQVQAVTHSYSASIQPHPQPQPQSQSYSQSYSSSTTQPQRSPSYPQTQTQQSSHSYSSSSQSQRSPSYAQSKYSANTYQSSSEHRSSHHSSSSSNDRERARDRSRDRHRDRDRSRDRERTRGLPHNPLPAPPQDRYPTSFTPSPTSPTSASHSHSHSQSHPRSSQTSSQSPMVRRGYWNKRGDHLTQEGYVVYAPQDRANPSELANYPSPTEGYRDHTGAFVKYDPKRPELQDSLPKHGMPPKIPYERFVSYLYA